MTKILVVDDNPTNRKLVARVLAAEGYEIFEAADGADGLASARAHHPQLVISDILMPTMDGYEFVRRLRQEPELDRAGVIFYTANYHEREAHSLARQCRVDRVIIKPCEPTELVRCVKSVLDGSPRSPSTAPGVEFDVEHLRVLTDKLSQKADELKAANEQLAALLELNVQLASERDPRTLLAKVCNGARALLAARFAVLAAADKWTGATAFSTISGLEQTAPATAIEVDSGLLGKVMHERRALRVANGDGSSVDVGLPHSFGPVRGVLAAPICSLTRSYGWVCLADKVGATEFGADDERILTILGAQVGRIYENGGLYAEVQNYAAELLVEMGERERAVTELLASEERFRQLAENIDDVLYIVTPDLNRFLYVSPAYERVWGRSRQELIDDPRLWLEYLHPDDRDSTLKSRDRIAAALPDRRSMEFRVVRPDGSVRWIQTRIFAICDERGTVVRAVGVSTDVTERHLAESRVRQLNRVHSMLSGVNSLIIRAGDRDFLLKEVCRFAIEVGQFGMAWCGLLERTAPHVRAMAWAGDFNGLQPHAGLRLTAVPSDNPILVAIQSRQPFICNELRESRADAAYVAGLLRIGYRALVVLPLIIANESVGCMALATRESGTFDEHEMRLLTEFAGDISFALDHLEKAERLNYLALYDLVTGLANRNLFQERLAQHASAAQHSNVGFAVLIASLDRIDTLIDTIGRTAVDTLTHEVADRFSRCIGDADLVGRVGPTTLAAILTGLREATEVSGIVEELWRKWLSAPFDVAGQQIAMTATAGVAVYPADGTDSEALLRNAEAALRDAQSSGKRFGAFTAHLSEQLAERSALEKNILRALEHEEFVLHYQPKVDLESRRLKGVEALIRWQSPELGLVPPVKFIPLVEESGLIVEVGAWVLRQAILDRSRWIERGLNAPRVAINVSTVQLRREDFVRTLSTALRAAGHDSGIDIEVTESLLMEDATGNIAKLAAIRDLGVGIAIDDFGTGYSSLSYLAKLPVGTLKIDRSFVAAMMDDPSTMTLVSTILSLAAALKLETVAEGVESEDQARILRLLRCDQMQGFLIARPLPFDDMTAYLGRARA